MTEQNGKAAGKKQLIVNAFVEMCKLFENDIVGILKEARPLIRAQAVGISHRGSGDIQRIALGVLQTLITGLNWQLCWKKRASMAYSLQTYLVATMSIGSLWTLLSCLEHNVSAAKSPFR